MTPEEISAETIASDPPLGLTPTERTNLLGPESEAGTSTKPNQGQDGHETDEYTDIRFTTRDAAALDDLAAALTADLTSGLGSDRTSPANLDPADIAAVLERVMNADVDDLAAAVTVAAGINQGPADGELALGQCDQSRLRAAARRATSSPATDSPKGLGSVSSTAASSSSSPSWTLGAA